MATTAQGGRMRPQTFGDAFREARLAGDKTFEFKGETYSTKTAEEQGREIAQTARGSGRGASAGRMAADRDMAPMRAEAPKRAVIPGAPASQAEPIEPTMGSRLSSGLSDTAQKALAATGIAAGVGGLGYAALRAKRAADAAKAAEELRKLEVPAYAAAKRAEANQRAMSSMKEGLAKDLAEDIGKGSVGRGTPMRSTATSAETGRRYTPAQEMEAATSAARGAAGRRQVQETRTGRSQAVAEAKAEKPILRSEKAKETPRSRTRDEEDIEFKRGGKIQAYAKGGSVRGAGIAQRGVKKCKVY